MTPRYDGLRHPDRDKAIQEYANQHPDFSHEEIAQHFGLSRSRITQILGKNKEEVK